MGGKKPTLGYASRTDAVEALRATGLSTVAIANRLGVKPKDVSALENSRAQTNAKRAVRPSEQNSRTVLFPIDTLNRLERPAEVRGITVNELCRRIVETAVDDGMIDNILDDMDGCANGVRSRTEGDVKGAQRAATALFVGGLR